MRTQNERCLGVTIWCEYYTIAIVWQNAIAAVSTLILLIFTGVTSFVGLIEEPFHFLLVEKNVPKYSFVNR